MTVLELAIEKIEDDLLWVGPKGKKMGYIALTRAMAEAVLAALQTVKRE